MEDDWVAETAADLLAKCKAIPRHFVRLVALSERRCYQHQNPVKQSGSDCTSTTTRCVLV
jgi:hypothetical protein